MSSINKFSTLGVDPDIVEALSKRGITEPFEIQEISIQDALDGRDVCGKAKTGSGKTLAFGIPCVQRVSKAKPGRPSISTSPNKGTSNPSMQRAQTFSRSSRYQS